MTEDVKVLLERFRAKSAAFSRYQRPFHDGRNVYATNGMMAVRVPAGFVDLQGVDFCTLDVRNAMLSLFSDCVNVEQWPEILAEDIPPVDKRVCPLCDQQGLVWVCPKCGGSGTKQLDNGYRIDCIECAGHGVRPGKRSLDTLCRECGGQGWFDANALHPLIFRRNSGTAKPDAVAARIDLLRKAMDESPDRKLRYRSSPQGSQQPFLFVIPSRELCFAAVPMRSNDPRVLMAKFVLEDMVAKRLSSVPEKAAAAS